MPKASFFQTVAGLPHRSSSDALSRAGVDSSHGPQKKPLVSSRGPLKRTSPLNVYKSYLPAKHVMILVLTGNGQRVGKKTLNFSS